MQTDYRVATAKSGPSFVEIAQEAGIDFRHINGASGRYYYVEAYGSGAVFLDYDNDGYQDLYAVNGAPLPGFEADGVPTNAFYRNRGDGTFTDVTVSTGTGHAGYGMGSCVGDIDNDGFADLYVTNFGPNVLYRNRGDGTFADVTAAVGVGDARLSTSAAFADIDNDGDLDLYVANNARIDLESDEGCRRGEIPVYCAPTEYPGESGVLYRNDSSGKFADITRAAGLYNDAGRQLGVVFGDYDTDGDTDLYVANDMTANFLYRNDGQARFAEVGLSAGVALSESARPEAGMGTDFGDFDRDGDLDIAVCNFQWEACRLYRNDGDDAFADMSFASGLGEPTLATLTFGTDFLDYDNDGDLDLYLANGHVHPEVEAFDKATSYPQLDQLFVNDGSGKFALAIEDMGPGMALAGVSRGAAFADIDNDGDMDAFVSNNNQRPFLLRNDGGNRNHWLAIKTIGRVSNRDGIGARVKVISGDLVQIEEVRSGSSYLSQNDLRVYFGLGRRERVDRVEIRWPSGIVQTLEEMAIDSIHRVEEPETSG
ncbi:MAG: CRTAC1 family protein [Gemmatimonadetes bacterium]|nr:CRTAC1 family protein [Gemmatimonadota bacterium]MBT5324531.1 CRTAC1 family protein [Gemmatimonadota bacterium]MBT5448410.1 CRTAC1 family protein [Gemmatimonadota bacterium]MBT5803279.1 CRTAC1 family protein [Gemmatimonadota bacterium]MBT6621894.1 CRTAC1 family protein [Gemmatimonadota bacterium]